MRVILDKLDKLFSEIKKKKEDRIMNNNQAKEVHKEIRSYERNGIVYRVFEDGSYEMEFDGRKLLVRRLEDGSTNFGGKIIRYLEEKNAFKVDGRLACKSDIYNARGKHRVKFTFVSSNGTNEQLIILAMDKKFDGEISWNDQKYKIPKCAFPTLDLYEKHMGKEFILDIDLKNDDIHICNGVVSDGYVRYWSGNNEGMYIEEITPKKKRYICNSPISKDFDFDDFIFEVEILD